MLLIFDWDGTLIDSKAKITQAMQLAAQDVGWVPLESSLIHNIIGLSLPEAILRLYPSNTDAERLRIKELYSDHFVRLDKEKSSEFFPSVIDSLTAMRNQGHRLAVATGKSRRGLDRILRSLDMVDFFDATRCADETESKPDPLMLNQLLTQFGTRAEDAVMVGDTEYDMEMAQRIGMPRIAVTYGVHHVDRLRPYAPELCLDRFDQMLSWEKLTS